MASNRGVAYIKRGEVQVQSIDFPKLVDASNGKKIEHGVILKIISTNICGSDQHMVRGRTTAPSGLILGHEITGEVIEAGRDVLFIQEGDIVSVPFNIACGRCRNCKEQKTGICLNVNTSRPGFQWSRACLALALLLGCAIPSASADAAAVPSVIETGTRLGDVRLFESEGTPKELLFLFSDRQGWNHRLGAAAIDMAAHDVAVVGVDLKRYLQALADSGDGDCHYLDSDIEQLSKQLQSKLGIAQYRWPILAGIGAGGVLAYGAAAQAPDATIAGALVVDPAPSLDTRLPLCSGAPASRLAPGGFSYGPMPDMPGWLRVADRHQPSSMPWVEQIAGAERVTVPAGSDARGALVTMLLPMIGFAMPTGQGLEDLPLAEVPATHSPVALAVILSGDGGWRDIDKQIGQVLAKGNIGVVGLDSLRYFWSARTPEQVGRDLDRIVAHYQAAWGVHDVLLIGYSFGADVLPASYNQMSPATRSAVVEISLLGLAEEASFEFHVSSWLGLISSDGLPVAPEVARLDVAKVQCFYGEEEGDSLCRNPVLASAELIETKGGHHFDGDYQALTRRIIQGYDGRKQT